MWPVGHNLGKDRKVAGSPLLLILAAGGAAKWGLGVLWSWGCAGIQLLAGAGADAEPWLLPAVTFVSTRKPQGCRDSPAQPPGSSRRPQHPWVQASASTGLLAGPALTQHQRDRSAVTVTHSCHPAPALTGVVVAHRARSRLVCQRGSGRALMSVPMSPHAASRGQVCPRDPQAPRPGASSVRRCRDSGL